MDRATKLHRLYSELEAVNAPLKTFAAPRSADHPGEWTQEEAEQHAFLIKQRNDIIAEIAELEATP